MSQDSRFGPKGEIWTSKIRTGHICTFGNACSCQYFKFHFIDGVSSSALERRGDCNLHMNLNQGLHVSGIVKCSSNDTV